MNRLMFLANGSINDKEDIQETKTSLGYSNAIMINIEIKLLIDFNNKHSAILSSHRHSVFLIPIVVFIDLVAYYHFLCKLVLARAFCATSLY